MAREERTLRVHNVVHPLEHARSIVEIAAFVIAAAWGAYTFAYQEIFKPASEPPRLEAAVSVTHVPLARGETFVTVRVQYQNPGKSEIDLAAESVTVWGRRVGTRDARDANGRNEWQVDRSRVLSPRTLVFDSGSLRDAVVSGDRGRHFILAPGATGFEDYTFVVPQRRFDLIDVAFATWFLRANYGSHRVALSRRMQSDGSSEIVRDRGKSLGAEAYADNGVGSFPI